MKALRLVCACTVALGALGAGTALAAPGGGATSEQGPCLVSIPGFPDAEGTAHLVITPSGNEHLNCDAQLPSGTTAPTKPLKLSAGPCSITVLPSGRVDARC